MLTPVNRHALSLLSSLQSDMNKKKVNKIKKMLREGKFVIDEKKIADAIINLMI